MSTKTKTPECVKIKDDAQASLMAEYRSRKAEFASYDAFLEAKADEDPWIRRMRERFRGQES